MDKKYVRVPVEPTDEMRKAWNVAERNSESYFSEHGYRAMIAAAPAQPSPKVIECRLLQTEAAHPMVDWIDGCTDDEPAFSWEYRQIQLNEL